MVLAVIGAGIGASLYFWLPSQSAKGPIIISHVVKSGPFRYDVVERGELESAKNVDVRCEVKAQKLNGMTILEVVKEGTHVKKGDVLVRLDASGLEQDLLQQQIKCNAQEAAMVTSKNQYEAAQISLKEYAEGTFRQEEQQLESEILIAKENLRRSQEYLAYSERLSARGYVTPQQLEGDRFAVDKSRTELDTAKTKLRVLREYTKLKTTKLLESDIKSAEAAWLADQNSYKLELTTLKIMEEQIAKCEILAPQAGQVIHANERSRRGDSEFIVEPGATVREGQTIVRIPDWGAMQVKAKINESQIADIKAGLPATIRIDAYGDRTLKGEVTRVNEYPEPTSWFSSQVKEYATFVSIDNASDDLKPGLTAEATIHVRHEDNATLVPLQAIYEHGRDTYCIVKSGDQWIGSKIEIGGSNDTMVSVINGVQVNDVVAMNPRALLNTVKLPKIDDTDETKSPTGTTERPTASSKAPHDKKLRGQAAAPRNRS